MSMTRRIVIAGLALLALSVAPAYRAAAGPAGSPGKPGAPVDVRWLETGADGRISVEVSAGVDYDTLELRLLIPGMDSAPAPVRLESGAAGAIRRADWYLAGEPDVAVRLLVIIEAGGQRLARVVPGPSADSKRGGPASSPAAMPKATPDGLIEMRGETRHHRETGRSD
jgi:hypothetical protein